VTIFVAGAALGRVGRFCCSSERASADVAAASRVGRAVMAPVYVVTAAADGAVAEDVAGVASLRTACRRRRLDSAFCGYSTAALASATPATNRASGEAITLARGGG
jgi:hypothetical protein